MKTNITSLLVIFIFNTFSNLYSQNNSPRLFINEFMASNSTTILSPSFNEYSDWLEIYNSEDTTVDLSGYFLTDDFSDSQKWKIPINTRINSGESILFWADGNDEGSHTNFKLSQNGGEIALFSNTSIVIDSAYYSQQIADISFGRYPDGNDSYFYFNQPTPGASNTNLGFNGMAKNPMFSLSGGFHNGEISLELIKENPMDTIRYTIDGSLPNIQSTICSTAILLNSTTVIRAQTFRDEFLPSKVITQTYFMNETTTLPVVSVATDPVNLWDNETGIYVEGTNGIAGFCSSEPRNWNQPWEHPISLEMYEANGDFGFKADAGMQIGGGCTRLYPQKTLAIFVRSKYGASKINYKIFDDKNIVKFNNILLRNNGQDWWRAMFRDGMMQTLVKDQMDIDWQAYKPVLLFLNGEYWGIHSIREKHNEHYLESNYGIDPDKIDILSGNAYVKQGSAQIYKEMINFVDSHDMTVKGNYDWISTQMDINEYLNYIIAEVYFANIDWPRGNIKYWREHGENNKWRWILFDTDLGFGAHDLGQYDSNTLENATATTSTYYANPPSSTLLLRKLLGNTEFKNQFIQRFASHLNITFNPQRVLNIIDSLKTAIAPEIPRHILKWEKSTSFNEGWNYHVEVMNEFATKRPSSVLNHIIGKFGLSGSAILNVNNNAPNMGDVFINNVKLPVNLFSGTYLKDIPIQCKSIPKHGYKFVKWQGVLNSNTETVSIVLTEESNLEAIFEIDDSVVYHGLRINEILAVNDQTNIDMHGEYDDWIELFNDSNEAIDIGGMYLTNDLTQPGMSQISASAPGSTTIQPGDFLLLWADRDTTQGILHLNFKLGSDGAQIGLSNQTDSGFIFTDTLTFGIQTADVSFGRAPDGGDNFQYFDPTPGYKNIITDIEFEDSKLPRTSLLNQNYPNPFNPTTTINYSLKTDGLVSLKVYNVLGKNVITLVNERQAKGNYKVAFDGSQLPSGVYIYRIQSKNYVNSKKMILMK